MKYVLSIIFTVITMVTCSALGFVDPDAPKKDPEWTRALKYGAKAKIELHVVDDDGIPVPNANVIVIMGMISRSYLIEGETNTNGIFVIEGKTKGNSIEIKNKKEDYYSSYKKLCFIELGKERQVKNRKWQPYGEKETIILRKKKNPQKHILKIGDERFKHTKKFYEWIGFDIQENDFVEPYGKGKIADFDVMIEWDQKNSPDYTGMSMKIKFTEPFSGYYVVDKALYSDLKSPYEAIPENIKLTTETIYERKIDKNNWEKNDFDENKCWIVRSRPVVDDKGNLISANYSSIYNIRPSVTFEKSGGICIFGYFNSIPNDTNLEPVDIYTISWTKNMKHH